MPDLFTAWTPAERWLAGLLWADGHVSPHIVPGKDKIILSQCDPGVVADAIAIVGPDHRFRTQAPRKPTHRPCHYVEFTDRADVLWRLGLEGKPERRWPAEIASAAFLRGLFDGDGYVCQRPDVRKRSLRTVLCSPAAVLEGARDWLAGQGIEPKDLRPHGNSWALTWGHRDSLRLGAIMYAEPGPCMSRKQAFFREP